MMNSKKLLAWGIVILTLFWPAYSPARPQNAAAQISPIPPTPNPAAPGVALPPGSTGDWWAVTQANIQKSEYNITWQEQTYLADAPAAYQAPNRAHNLRTYFIAGGPVIVPRVWDDAAAPPPWRWELRLSAGGATGLMPALAAGDLQVQLERAEYQRPELLETYANSPAGLAQQVNIPAPAGEQTGIAPEAPQSYHLVMQIASSLAAQMTPDGSAIEFMDAQAQPVLRYGPVTAQDAAGRTLATRLAWADTTLSIEIDSAAAVYPLQVQALITGLPAAWNWRVEGNAVNTKFGAAVYTAGDVNNDWYSDVIVGAPYYDGGQNDEGKAFVFHGSASGLSTTAAWTKESDQTGAQFGAAVSTAGDVNGDNYSDVIVGAPYWESTGTQADEGGIWIYHGSAGGLSSVPNGHAESDQAGAQLGVAVAAAGNVNGDAYADVIAGASYYSSGHSAEGVVRVWHGSEEGISAAHNWQAQSNQADAHLGNSVSGAGDINGDGYADIVVGAPEYDNGHSNEGTAMVWYGSLNGVNNDVDGTPSNAVWQVESNEVDALFGVDVSTAGDVNGDGFADVIIGSSYHSDPEGNEGGAYVFHGSASGLPTRANFHQEGNLAGANLGTAVDTAGDINGDGYADVIIGAPNYTNGETHEGSVWVWLGSHSGLKSTAEWNNELNQADARYGIAVAPAGDVNGDGYSDVIIGASGYHNPTIDEGAAFVYHGSPATLSEVADWNKRSNQEGAYFGWSVSTAGDVNGDGYADIIVGASLWDAGHDNDGGAWVYHGADSGLISTPAWYTHGDQLNQQYGFSVSTAGDVNGDGYSDVIVGANMWDHGHTDEGGAWTYYGASGGLDTTADWIKDSDNVGAQFGFSVATAGDVNGDGYSDVIVGSPFLTHALTDDGMAWVYLGADSGLRTTPSWHADGGDTGAQFGYAVGTAGDVNRDGYSDIIVGSPYWDDDAVNEGRAWVFLGSSSGPLLSETWHAESNLANANMGWSVGTAGDVNGDGYSDIIVGAPHWGDGGLSSEGKVWVYHGSAAGPGASSAWSREGGQNQAYYGYAVATAGDVNGDGYADIILGAPLMTGSVSDEGTARVYCGASGGLHTSYDWKGEGGQTLSWYGIAVASAGDVNGDGYADVIVGAKDYNETFINEGRVQVYYGNASRGVSLIPRQTRLASNVSIAPLGSSDSRNRFSLSAAMWPAYGRSPQQQQFEVKALGTQFNGTDLRWWGYYTNLTPGTVRYVSVSPLPAGKQYHWRMRLVYNPASTPFQRYTRWITLPWNGWNEADLRLLYHESFLPLMQRP